MRYVHIEVGHVGENVYLQAEALGLGTVAVGAFSDEFVSRILSLPKEQKPLYIMPVGYPR
jgi:nitroreductase